MEKFLKTIRLIAILLLMLFIIVIGFIGVYARNNGVWENVLPKYSLGMDFDGYSELHFELDNAEDTKEIFVDENGNYKGDVIKQKSQTATENSEGSEKATESKVTEVNPETEYKIEKRTIPRNDPSKINIENFEKTKNIIQKRLEKYNLIWR